MEKEILENLIREEVKAFKPYIPGKPIDEVKRNFKLKKVYKLASNENSLGCSKKVISKLKKTVTEIFRYPESSCYYLREAIAKKLNIDPNCLLFGNGSDEIIELLGKTFLNKQDEIITSKHSFIRYAMSAQLMGAYVKEVRMKSLNYDVEEILRNISRKTKIIFIGNPNNPTGTYINDNSFKSFIERVPKNILVVMDEAYYEYVTEKDYPNTIEYMKKYSNIITLRTFSKLYSLAGLRVGYMIADKNVIDYVERMRPPFNVNILAQIAAKEVLTDKKHYRDTLSMIEKGKKYIYQEFDKLNIEYVKSSTNFILFKTKIGGTELFKLLLQKGVIIRAVDEYELKDYARVTIGKMEENKKFISSLKMIIGG